MESSEILVQEMFLFVKVADDALALMSAGRTPEAQEALRAGLAAFKATCSENKTTAALATLMQGFQPPTDQPSGMPAMHNPL